MSGNPYKMKEMKLITDYLVEHKAYGEIKGRKMWVDFASSKVTNRTWQSLKETFLKRILPDIQNPYYQLDLLQIASFKQGCDVEAKMNNKLEIQNIDIENTALYIGDNAEEENHKNGTEITKNNKNDADNVNNVTKNIADHRTSTETLVLENCYESVEDLQRDLDGSEGENVPNETNKSPKPDALSTSKCEAPTVVQLVINDFTEDFEDSTESKLDKDVTNKPSPIPSIIDNNINENSKIPSENQNIPQCNEEGKQTDNITNHITATILNTKNNEIGLNQSNSDCNKVQEEKAAGTQNISNLTNDTPLPNNPEEFNKNASKDESKTDTSVKQTKNSKIIRKRRAISQDVKIRKGENTAKQLCISDSDIVKKSAPKQHTDETYKSACEFEKQSEIVSNDAQVINLDSDGLNNAEIITIPEVENPCLKSVSLYAEQFSCTVYSDEESNENGEKKDAPKKKTIFKEVQQLQEIDKESKKIDTVAKTKINISSDSVSEVETGQKGSALKLLEKMRKDKALANAFGFSNDVMSGNRKRRGSYNRKRSNSQRTLYLSSDSTDWSSDDNAQYISPPRARRNRPTKKILKPKPARVLSLEEEGGLFVMHGKKIYPVVKDGKIVKNYLTYASDDDVNQEQSYWKLKYVEEKKKADEFAKLLKEVHGRVSEVPATSSRRDPSVPAQASVDKDVNAAANNPEPKRSDAAEEKIVKIKFTKNNEELQLEGHWTHIHPVLDRVMSMLNKDDKNVDKVETKKDQEETRHSGVKETEVVETGAEQTEHSVNRAIDIEEAIFKEIEERDKEVPAPRQGRSVTKRKSSKVTHTASTTTSEQKTAAPNPKKAKLASDRDKQMEQQAGVETRRRSTRTPKKTIDDNTEASPSNVTVRKHNPKSNKSISKIASNDTETLYKFPSPPPAPAPANAGSTRRNRRQTDKQNSRYTIFASPENLSNDEGTTQGYIDSDASPIVSLRKKRRTSITLRNSNVKTRLRKRSTTPLEDTSESGMSYVTACLRTRSASNSSLSSRIYRSESYQLLMPKKQNSPIRLEKVVDCSPNPHVNNLYEINSKDNINNDIIKMNDNEASSNMTLPTSPVLSIVDNISICRNGLSHIDEISVDNSLIDQPDKVTLNELMSCEGDDLSLPLMEQNYDIEMKTEIGTHSHYTMNLQSSISESFLEKICTVQIQDPTMSDSMNAKLRDLLLESAKKLVKEIKSNSNNVENDKLQFTKSTSPKIDKKRKRSSTPRKKKCTSRSTAPPTSTFEDVVEQKHIEACSKNNRKSGPPVICIHNLSNDEMPLELTESPDVNVKDKGRKKKDIIKVKITRPKGVDRKTKKKSPDNHINDTQINNDSESGIFLQGLDDSVDLIHNHSETCLQAHDCIENSIVEVNDPALSIFSVDSNSIRSDKQFCSHSMTDDKLGLELIGSNAVDGTECMRAFNFVINKDGSEHALMTHSPTSLISEDLSVDIPSVPSQSSQWYLFSEEETNTNQLDFTKNVDMNPSYGANLNHIFPLTCAVPNLSTITETSKDNEDTNTKNSLDDNFKGVNI